MRRYALYRVPILVQHVLLYTVWSWCVSGCTWYLAVCESLVEDVRAGSYQPDAQGVQHHPLAPVNHTVCQLEGAEAVDSSSEAPCNTLERSHGVRGGAGTVRAEKIAAQKSRSYLAQHRCLSATSSVTKHGCAVALYQVWRPVCRISNVTSKPPEGEVGTFTMTGRLLSFIFPLF